MSKKAVFIFSHPALFNVWQKAQEIAKKEELEIIVINQGAHVDWTGESARIIEEADAVYFAGISHFPNFEILVAACKKARYVLASGMEASAAFDAHDATALKRMHAYLTAGTAQDFVNAACYLLHKSGAIEETPPAPVPPLLCGIYHPRAEGTFPGLSEYLEWNKQQTGVAEALPLVAVCFPRAWMLSEDMALVLAVIGPLQRKGFLAVPVFCESELAASFGMRSSHPLDRILRDCGNELAAIWCLLSTYSGSGDGFDNPFLAYDAPVFQVLRNYNQSVAEWRESQEGLSAMTICYGLTKPEMLGCVEPTLLACNEMTGQEDLLGRMYKAIPVPERIEHLAERTAGWYRLRTKANSEKRVAIMLHQAPCKGVEAPIATAAGLDAAESAVAIMNRLRDEGYAVADIPSSGRALLDLILEKKAISEFRWTNVEEIAAKGGVIARICREDYERDFTKLSDAVRKRCNDSWGEFPGDAMVYGKESDDACLLITGIWFGNILVMVEPKRGCWGPKCDGEVCRILHEPDIPPTHHWMASYWYLQREVDALVSLGTESPLEYLPGKRAALSGDCYPEISLGPLPLIYPYIFSATGEGLMAKRRGRGVLIDHLTPPIARLTDDDAVWAEMEALHAQYCAARDVKDGRRLASIAEQLRELMVDRSLLEPEADDEKLKLRIEQLPRRIEKLRRRFTEKRAHVLGKNPDPEAVGMYVNEARGKGERPIDVNAMRAALMKTSDEMSRLVSALSARFIPPGPSGHLSRGKVDVLPSGRNFYGTDLEAIPTRAAWETGSEMGRMILQQYLDDEGVFPRSIAITLWSSDVFRADGELVSQALWLSGCRPKWAAGGGRVEGIELMPREDLIMDDGDGKKMARPRIDIVIQMSGVVRDTLPNIYMMLDEAVEIAAAQEEPEEVNYIHAHVKKRMQELSRVMADTDSAALGRLARCRVFSSKPGSYGTGIGLAIDAAAWENDKDLAEAYVNWTGYAYGKDLEGKPPIAGNEAAGLKEYARLMGAIDIAYQKAIGPEYDAMSTGCYSSFQGGMAVVNRVAGAGKARLYWGDSSSGEKPEVRTLNEEIFESFIAKLLNPDWIDQKKLDGSIGAHNISCTINTMFHWAATAHAITDEQFDAVWRTYIEDEDNRQWLQSENIYALEEITRRLLEAASRTMWHASEEKLEMLRHTMLSIEGDIEERMGPVRGEFQGSAVDIKRRRDVEKWHYAYTLDDGKD